MCVVLVSSVRSQTMNLFNWLYWLSAFKSDSDLSVSKLQIMRVQIAQARVTQHVTPNVDCNKPPEPHGVQVVSLSMWDMVDFGPELQLQIPEGILHGYFWGYCTKRALRVWTWQNLIFSFCQELFFFSKSESPMWTGALKQAVSQILTILAFLDLATDICDHRSRFFFWINLHYFTRSWHLESFTVCTACEVLNGHLLSFDE